MKRFSKEKMIQVEQLISYATLMGLTGTDLISIGGRIEREKANIAKKANMEIINSFTCLPYGVNRNIDDRFKLKTPNGNYNFTRDSWDDWKILSLKTDATRYHHADRHAYDLPRSNNGWCPSRYALLLDIAAGKLQLNF